MGANLLARDVMHRDVLTVAPETDIWETARLLTRHRITGAPVVDSDGDVVGVISQTDIVRHLKEIFQQRFREHDFYAESEEGARTPTEAGIAVRNLMNRDVIRASEETPIGELSATLLRLRVHRIIITHGRKLRGIVTSMDLLRYL